MLLAFIGPLFRMIAELNGLAHLLFWPTLFAAVFTLGYAWRHWGHDWLWFTVLPVPTGAPSVTPVESGYRPATSTENRKPPQGGSGTATPDPLDQLTTAADAVKAMLAHEEADAKAAAAAAEAKAKADAAALAIKREKLAAVAGALAPTPKPVA